METFKVTSPAIHMFDLKTWSFLNFWKPKVTWLTIFFIEIAMSTYSAETDHISYIVGCMLINYSIVSLFVNHYISQLFFAVIGPLIIMIVMTMIILLVFYFHIYI